MNAFSRTFCLVLIACSLSACGYRFGHGELLQRYATVCIPFVEGDDEGLMTAALIRATAAHGVLTYKASGADLLLKVCLIPIEEETIGFIYAPKEKEDQPPIESPEDVKLSNIITSHEARFTLRARVSLVDRRSGECLFGPLVLFTSLDFDYEPDQTVFNKNQFSLGQLEMHNIAMEAAFPPLYDLLAEKIVDYVNNSW